MRNRVRSLSLDDLIGLLLVLTLAAYPLDPYRIVGTGLSLFRVFGLAFVGLTALRLLRQGRARWNVAILALAALLVYISVHYFSTAPHSGWAASKFLAYAFGIILALAVAQRRAHVASVLLGLQLAFWATVPFVAYSLYAFLVRQTIITGLPPLPGFYVGTGGWLSQGHNFEGLVRLAAPFPAPQFLGLLAAIAAFISLWLILRHPRGGAVRWFRYLTLATSTFIALGSLSRSALLPGALWVGALLLTRARYRGAVLRFALPAALAVAIVVGVGAQLGIGNLGEVAVERATSAPASFGRHLETRLTALSLWAATPATVLVGTAFGEYGRLWAADGPHSHSPYTTLLAEVGLVGVGLLVLLLGALLHRTWGRTGHDGIMFWLVSMVAFALVLYEFLALQYLWAVIGAGAAVGAGGSVSRPAGAPASGSSPRPPEPV